MARIAGAILLLCAFAAPGAQADPDLDHLNTLKLKYDAQCTYSREMNAWLKRREQQFWRWFDLRDLGDFAPLPQDALNAFREAVAQQELMEVVAEAQRRSCNNARDAYHRGLREATLTLWIEGPVKPPTAVTPPPPVAPPPAARTKDPECERLKNQGMGFQIDGIGQQNLIGKREGPHAEKSRIAFGKALALYRQGAARCMTGHYPELFARKTREVEQSLRAVGGRP